MLETVLKTLTMETILAPSTFCVIFFPHNLKIRQPRKKRHICAEMEEKNPITQLENNEFLLFKGMDLKSFNNPLMLISQSAVLL